MKIRARLAIAGLLFSMLTTIGLVSVASPAQAYCSGGPTPYTGTCSQVKHKENNPGAVVVQCVHVGGWSAIYSLAPGQSSDYNYACAFVQWIYTIPGTELWCRPLGYDVAYSYYWSGGWHLWDRSGSLNCKVVGL